MSELLVLERQTERFADIVVMCLFAQELLSELKQNLASPFLDDKRAPKLLPVAWVVGVSSSSKHYLYTAT